MNLGTIQHVYSHRGPFVTLDVDVSRATEDAPQQLTARWTTARHRLEEAGIAPDVVEDLGARLHERTGLEGEVRRTMVAADGEVVLDEVTAGHATWPETTACGPLPALSGWLSRTAGQVPFLLVVADREGADLGFYRALSHAEEEHEEVHGGTLHITKVPQGDWAHPQYQRRSENLWRRNAEEVAEEVQRICRAHRPRVVVLAGDERARRELEAVLEGVPCEIRHTDAGGRAAGTSGEALWEDVHRIVSAVDAEDVRAVTERLAEATGQERGAVHGLGPVLDALVQGQVERLVVDLQAMHEVTVDPADHEGLALPQSAKGAGPLPADEVLVAAGAATDVEISPVPHGHVEATGVAALLRWDM